MKSILWEWIICSAAFVIGSAGVARSASDEGTQKRTASALAADKGTVLVVVNGDSITASDLDLALIRTHRTMDADAKKGFDYTKLLNKLVNDQILLQEAESIGMDEEPEIQERLNKALSEVEVRSYTASAFTPPDSVSESDVRTYFKQYYWRITFRMLSTATRDEAARLAKKIRGGASMDALARASSIDPWKSQGGLRSRALWADVELPLRPVLERLKPVRVSDPFPLFGNWSIARVEERFQADEKDYATHRRALKSFLTGEKRKEAWKVFMSARETEFPVTIDNAAVARIFGDSSRVFDASFRNDAPGVVLKVDSKRVMTEGELRTKVSHEAMQAGEMAFRPLFRTVLEKAKEELILPAAAERMGAARDPKVLARFGLERKDILVQTYLGETVGSKIRFSRGEFQAYYDKHKEDFRGPDEVQLSDLIVQSKTQADSIAKRLQAGADFDYVKRKLGLETAVVEPKWTPITVFSEKVRSQIDGLKIGSTTDPLPVADGWVIWKVLGRRRGEVKALDDVEMQIREAMFQQKFNALLDAQLKKLKARARIHRNEAAIAQYFQGAK